MFHHRIKEKVFIDPIIVFEIEIVSVLVDDFGALIDGLDIKKAKRAGQYLDGCSVSLTFFV